MSLANWYIRFKAKYHIRTDRDAVLIILVFAITGSLSVRIGKPVLAFFHLTEGSMSPWIFWPLRILIIFPIYQFLLVVIGFLLGQFTFFWEFEKKTFGRLFGYKPKQSSQE